MPARVQTVGSAPTVHRGLRCCGRCRAIYRADFERCPIDGGELAVVATDPLLGETVAGQYVIDALLGEGAMGRVYRVHHSRLRNKRYALKILIGDFAASTEMRMRFANEAAAVAKLDHPNIVDVIDFGRTPDGLMYLAMDLVEGKSLGAVARMAPMPAPRLLEIARQLCDGLVHAHARGVVHRDFKPDNILLDDGGAPRIADFGLAISVMGDDPRLTTNGVCCTPAYAAPEQLFGGAIDHRVDLYALGATLFELASGGVMAFEGEPREIVTRKLATRARPIREVAPDLPTPIASVIDRLLASSPDDRFESAVEVRAALDGAVATRPARSRLLAVVTAALALAVWLDRPGVTVRAPMLDLPLAPAESVAPRSAATVHQDLPPTARRHAQVARAPEPSPELPPDPPPDPPSDPPRDLEPAAPSIVLAPAADVPPAGDAVLALAPHDAAPATIALARIEALPVVAVMAAPAPPPGPLHIVELDVGAALSRSVVRRAIERTLAGLRCDTGANVVAKFTISDGRRAIRIETSGPGAACVSAALVDVRTEDAPDVGDAEVEVTLAGS